MPTENLLNSKGMNYLTAKENLIKGNPNSEWFKNNNHILEYGYSLLLEHKPDEALKVFKSISENDIRANWGEKLIPVITKRIFDEEPTFLQVRNFLEIDLDILLKIQNTDYATNLINSCEYFYSICRESYKFIGRALYYNDYKDLALDFFLASKDRYFNDPETHYLLSLLYLDKKEKEKGEHEIKACLRIIPEYLPAKKILERLEKI